MQQCNPIQNFNQLENFKTWEQSCPKNYEQHKLQKN